MMFVGKSDMNIKELLTFMKFFDNTRLVSLKIFIYLAEIY